jgi:hypothetical protein
MEEPTNNSEKGEKRIGTEEKKTNDLPFLIQLPIVLAGILISIWLICIPCFNFNTSWVLVNYSKKAIAGIEEVSYLDDDEISKQRCERIVNSIDIPNTAIAEGKFTILKLKRYTTGNTVLDFLPFVFGQNQDYVLFAHQTITLDYKKEVLQSWDSDPWSKVFNIFSNSYLLNFTVYLVVFAFIIFSGGAIINNKTGPNWKKSLLLIVLTAVVIPFLYRYVTHFYMANKVFYSPGLFLDAMYYHLVFLACIIFYLISLFKCFIPQSRNL